MATDTAPAPAPEAPPSSPTIPAEPSPPPLTLPTASSMPRGPGDVRDLLAARRGMAPLQPAEAVPPTPPKAAQERQAAPPRDRAAPPAQRSRPRS